MKVKYIQCMDFTWQDGVELPDYTNILDVNKAIEAGKMIRIKSNDGEEDWVNSLYIMYVGV